MHTPTRLQASLCSLRSLPQRKLNYQRGGDGFIYPASNFQTTVLRGDAGKAILEELFVQLPPTLQLRDLQVTFVSLEGDRAFGSRSSGGAYLVTAESRRKKTPHFSSAGAAASRSIVPARSGDASLQAAEMDGPIIRNARVS